MPYTCVKCMIKPNVSFRLDEDALKKLDEIIESGEFSTRTEIIKYALRQFLKNWDGKRF